MSRFGTPRSASERDGDSIFGDGGVRANGVAHEAEEEADEDALAEEQVDGELDLLEAVLPAKLVHSGLVLRGPDFVAEGNWHHEFVVGVNHTPRRRIGECVGKRWR